MDFLRLDGEGESFYRQPASMPIFQQKFANFLKDLRHFSKILLEAIRYEKSWKWKILHNTNNFHKYLRFAALPAEFCENRGDKWRIWTTIQQNFTKITNTIAKINGTKHCKFELKSCTLPEKVDLETMIPGIFSNFLWINKLATLRNT